MIPGLLLYLDDLHTFDGLLSDSDLGTVIRAIANYIETGEEAEGLSPVAMVCYRIIKAKVDREISKYAKQAENGAKGGRPKTQQNPTKPNETQSENGFSEQNSNNQKEKETETEKETVNTTTTSACVREETPFGEVTIDPLIVKVQRELLGLTDNHYDLLGQYRETLGDDLVSHAIDAAVANGVRKWAYVESILKRYETDGIRTVAEAKAADEKRKAQPKGRDAPKVVTAQRFTQRQYSDDQLEGEMSPLLTEALRKVKDDEGIGGAAV